MTTRRKGKAAGSAKRKEELLQVRLSAAEKKAFEESAELSGLAVSAWVRERLRRIAVQELGEAGREVPFVGHSAKDSQKS
jgi:hypothetical protein